MMSHGRLCAKRSILNCEAVGWEWGPDGPDGESTQYQIQMAPFVDSPRKIEAHGSERMIGLLMPCRF